MQIITPSLPRQRGLSLLEALVALVVSALGILGVAGIQLRTLSDTQNSVYRSQAVRLIEDLSERLRVQPNALLQINPRSGSPGYTVPDWGSHVVALGTKCNTDWCNADELAAWDIAQWHTLVTNTLPAGDAVVFPVKAEADSTGNRRQLGVLLRWRQNERGDLSDEDKKNTDTTLVKSGSDFQSGTGLDDLDKGCSAAGYACHLQYLTVSARCTAKRTPSGVWTHSCPQ